MKGFLYKDICVFRYHGGVDTLERITENDNKEGFWVGNGYIAIRAHKFSTYAVAYTTKDPGSAPGVPSTPSHSHSHDIDVWYIAGNSFGTSKSTVPTGVEIDGVPVGFTGDGREFTVSCIPAGARRVTVRWGSTSVSTNFTPDVNSYCTQVSLPKTGDASVMAYALMAVMAAAGAMGKK